jgi:2-oxoglutarate ferredoxin oxidoreductase subunit gamma
MANMVILGAVVQKTGVIALQSLKKALYPALDLRYHKMISINMKALDRGAKFVKEM